MVKDSGVLEGHADPGEVAGRIAAVGLGGRMPGDRRPVIVRHLSLQ